MEVTAIDEAMLAAHLVSSIMILLARKGRKNVPDVGYPTLFEACLVVVEERQEERQRPAK